MNKSTHSIVTYCIYFLFAILVLYPLLEFLNALPLYLWDESRQAANAIEMFTNHNWLVTYYNGSPDMWNTKPPLLIWLQVLSMHIFGLTTSALRAPSVIAAFATILSLFFFLKKETNNIWIAFFSGIVLVALPGFNGYHVARTGDYDSLLILFMIQCAIQFYYYIETKNRIHIILFGLFLTLGSLTKGIAPLLFLPGFLVYAFLKKKIYAIDKHSPCLNFIKDTAKTLKLNSILTDRADVFKYLEKSHSTFDVIFADPPYELENIAQIHDLVFTHNLLNEDGWLIIEHGQRTDLSSKMNYVETRKYGNVHFSFFSQKLS